VSADKSLGLTELAEAICFYVGAWHDFGYEEPPTPECATIPPLGERSANAIRSSNCAVDEIDKLTRQLDELRSQLMSEMRTDEDKRNERVDRMLAEAHKSRCEATS